MTLLTFLSLAALIGGGVYLILSARFSEVLIGIGLLSNGVNLLLLESSHKGPEGTDPLPQALILTAIVIGFALLAFLTAFTLNRVKGTESDYIMPSREDQS